MNWHYQQGTNRIGPVNDEAIEQLIASGTLTPENYVWNEEMPDWQPIKSTPLVSHLPRRTTPPPLKIGETPFPSSKAPSEQHFGRVAYFGSVAAIVVVCFALRLNSTVSVIVALFAGLLPSIYRLRDIGASGGYCLLTFVPIGNVILSYYLLCAPRGYAQTPIADKPMRILTGLFVCFLALIILLPIILIVRG